MPHFDTEWQITGRQINDRLNEIRGSIYGHRSPIGGWQAVVTGHKQGPSAPPVDGLQGRRALDLAYRVRDAIAASPFAS